MISSIIEEEIGFVLEIDTLDFLYCAIYFDNFILKAYGAKSEDGRHFKKSPELIEEFTQSAAYDALFMKMATDSSKAAAFVNAILPSDATSMIEANS